MAAKRSTLEDLIEFIQKDHKDRLDMPFMDELVPRKHRRPKPKTAIIGELAKQSKRLHT